MSIKKVLKTPIIIIPLTLVNPLNPSVILSKLYIYVCVCVCERERERDRQTEFIYVYMCIYVCVYITRESVYICVYICVCIYIDIEPSKFDNTTIAKNSPPPNNI